MSVVETKCTGNGFLCVTETDIIYFGIAMVTCLGICCPAFCLYLLCCAPICRQVEDKEGRDDTDDTDGEIEEKFVQNGGRVTAADIVPGNISKRMSQRSQSSMSWLIPIRRAEPVHKAPATYEDVAVVPKREYDGGRQDGDWDVDSGTFIGTEEEKENSVMSHDSQDMEVDTPALAMRVSGHYMEAFCKVDTQSDVALEAADLEEEKTDTEHPSDFEVEMEIEIEERKLKEGLERMDENTSGGGGVAGGMGVTRLDLEDALDDGLSIVASSGFIYEHSSVTQSEHTITGPPVPSSNTNESTPVCVHVASPSVLVTDFFVRLPIL